MKASEIYKNFKKKLTERTIFICSVCKFLNDWAGEFETAEKFNNFIEKNFYSDPD